MCLYDDGSRVLIRELRILGANVVVTVYCLPWEVHLGGRAWCTPPPHHDSDESTSKYITANATNIEADSAWTTILGTIPLLLTLWSNCSHTRLQNTN